MSKASRIKRMALALIDKEISLIKQRFDAGERSTDLRIYINEVCDGLSDDWEDTFWTRAADSNCFTLDDFEALPRPTSGPWAKPKPSFSLTLAVGRGLRNQ